MAVLYHQWPVMFCSVWLMIVLSDVPGYALALRFRTGCEMKARSQRKRGRERDLGRERVGGRGGLLASRVCRCQTSAVATPVEPASGLVRRSWIVDCDGVSCVTRRDASSEVVGAKPRLG